MICKRGWHQMPRQRSTQAAQESSGACCVPKPRPASRAERGVIVQGCRGRYATRGSPRAQNGWTGTTWQSSLRRGALVLLILALPVAVGPSIGATESPPSSVRLSLWAACAAWREHVSDLLDQHRI